MIAACTTLDAMVNRIRLRFAAGSRDARMRKIPSVAYTPTIIMKYCDSYGAPACHAQPDGQMIASRYTRQKTTPNTISASLRSVLRSDMLAPFAAQYGRPTP